MKKTSARLLFTFLGISTLASMVGAISGSVAWYAYVTRATMSYSGTSVNSTKQLQIGIKSAVAVDFPEGTISIDLPDPENPNGHYYFMNPGASLPATVINAYLSANGYTTTTLEPVSSYTYDMGDALNLKLAPTANKPFEARSAADKSKYVEIPFALRVLESDLLTPSYVANKPIYLTDAAAQAASSNDGAVYKAIRMFIDRDNGSDFLFNPSAEDDGATKVAGILDISGDDLYDYFNNMGNETYYASECLYGDYTLLGTAPGDPGFDDNYVSCLSPAPAATSAVVDANGSGYDEARTTFSAKHYQGIRYFDLASLEADGDFVPGYAEYLGTDTIYPTVNGAGELENGYAVCITQNNTTDNRYCIGEFTTTIYLEGWDFNVIDEELSHEFNLGLTFEIN